MILSPGVCKLDKRDFIQIVGERSIEESSCYRVGGGCDNSDWQGEEDGHEHGQEDSPVRELEGAAEALAGEDGEGGDDDDDEVEPPLRYRLVVGLHDPAVDVEELLVDLGRGLAPEFEHVFPFEEEDVGDGGGEGGEAEAVGDGEEDAEVDIAVVVVVLDVEGEGGGVEDAVEVVVLAGEVEEAGGEEGEAAGVVDVEPVSGGDENVDEGEIAGEDVEEDEGRGGHGASEEGGDGGPVDGEGTETEAVESGADLVGDDRVLPDPADEGEGSDGGEEVVGYDVVDEATGGDDEEELKAGEAALRPPLVLVQCSVSGDNNESQ